MMKIVYLSDSIIPSRFANSVHVMKMCQAFAKQGHQVTLLAPNVTNIEQGIDNLFNYYGVEPIFNLEKLTWPNFPGRVYVYSYFAVRRCCSLKPDLVYGRFIPACYLSAKYNFPTMLELHNPVSQFGFLFEQIFKRIVHLPSLQKITLISESLKNIYLKKYPFPDSLYMVLHDGADIMKSVTPMDLGNSNRLKVGYIGHLYEGRGIDIIMTMAKHCPWAQFHIVGGREEEVKEWKCKLIDNDNITLHGFVPPQQTPNFRHACDVLLAPYQRKVSIMNQGDSSKWMSPLKIFEYMEAGKAILVSDLPVLHEILTDKTNALFCNPDNPNDWIEALVRLKNDLSLRQTLGEKAKETLLNNYTWEKRVKKITKIYTNTMPS